MERRLLAAHGDGTTTSLASPRWFQLDPPPITVYFLN
jgi:hypothetical protein